MRLKWKTALRTASMWASGSGVLLASSCDATRLRSLGEGIIAVADIVDPKPEPDLGDVISSEVEDFFDKL
ncbi:MAG: hypothetical protein IT449_05100 [Phycisphaerales bacterium]|nr:hypothetical protein [Phycisphaerales bacterium]